MSWQVTSGKIPQGRGVGNVGFADAAETGSGSVVRGTSPTMTNPVVGTQSGGDNSTKAASTAYVTAAIATASLSGFPLIGYISGLTLSTAGSSATFSIAAGMATNSTNVAMMPLATAYTKTTSAWALGSAAGSLDTSTIANNTWYHVYEIQRSDTGVTDILISLSPSAPTMPTNYDRKRRIGAMKTDGSAHWIKFVQTGFKFRWDVPVSDFPEGSTGITTATTQTLTVPTGVSVIADINGYFLYGGDSGFGLITPLSTTDSVPSATLFNGILGILSQFSLFDLEVVTNTSAQIRWRVTKTTAGMNLMTNGWTDPL
jgi:hypothetical protein